MSNRRFLTTLSRLLTLPLARPLSRQSLAPPPLVVFSGSSYRSTTALRSYSMLSTTIAKFRKKRAIVDEKRLSEKNVVVQNAADEPLPAAVTDEIVVLWSDLRRLVRTRVDSATARTARNTALVETLERVSQLHASNQCGINPKNFSLINDVVAMIDHTQFLLEAHKTLFAVCMNGMRDASDNADFLKTIFLKFHRSQRILDMSFDEFKYFARYVSFLKDRNVLQSMVSAYISRAAARPGFDPAMVIEYGVYLEQEAGMLDVEETMKFTQLRLAYNVADAIQPLVDYYAYVLNRDATQTPVVAAAVERLLADLLGSHGSDWLYFLQLGTFCRLYHFDTYRQLSSYLLGSFTADPSLLSALSLQDLETLSGMAMESRAHAFGEILTTHIREAKDDNLAIQMGYVELLLQWRLYNGEDIVAALHSLCAARTNTGLHSQNPNQRISLDTGLYNRLLQTAFSSGMAVADVEAFSHQLQETYALQRDEETFWLLINRALDANDTAKGLEYFETSFTEGVLWRELDGKYKTVVNRLMKRLGDDILAKGAVTSKADCSVVWRWFTRLDQIKHKLDVYTAAGWMKIFLQNEKEYLGNAVTIAEHVLPPLADKGELDEIKPSEKADRSTFQPVYDVLYAYTLTSTLDATRNWSTLGFLDAFFIIPEEHYLPLMKKFCELDRPNAALILFKNIKRYHRFYNLPPPTAEIYIFLYTKFGEMYYEEGVNHLHKMMNMEVSVDVDVEVMNAALGAFVNLQDTLSARVLFHSMLAIPKEVGINEQTVSIMMKNYALMGIGSARRFWSSLSDFDILPTADNYKWFIIAHCHAGKADEALAIAQSMEENYVEVTTDVLASLHNWADAEVKAQVETWAQQSHPAVWGEVVSSGLLRVSEGETKLLATPAVKATD